ncbi:MAG: carbohydrate ABC transporter permease [bacterium]|nr:carbohydrate ABC transporter permease [bacterium]
MSQTAVKAQTRTRTKKRMKLSTRIGSVFMNAVLWLFSLSCIFPLVWMAYNSLKTKRVFNADKLSIPGLFGAASPTLDNYTRILTNPDYHLFESMWNSVRTTAISILCIVLCSFIVGYILSRITGKWNRPLYILFLSGMLIPIHSLLVPIYVVFKEMNMTNQWFTLLLPYISFGLPMGIFLVEGYVKSIPISMEEAAAIDGSSFSRTLWSIILPMCKPILVTVAIIQVFGCWNEFSFALVLIENVHLQTVPLALTQFKGQFGSDYPKQMAAMLITMLPIVIIYFIFSKQIIKGMVAGAVKG